MKSSVLFFLIAIFICIATGCQRVSPDGGTEYVLIEKPFFFGKGGVDDAPVSAGSVWVAATTSSVGFPVTPMTITESFENMIPADNTPVSFNAYLKVQIRKGATPLLYKNFSSDWYAHSLQATFRTMVRDKACAFKMFDLASKREISARLEQDIFKDLDVYAKKLGLPVDILQVSIGAITPPAEVLTETKLTAAQNQSILTQGARRLAEDARKGAEEAKAYADRAYQDKFGMSTEQYLHLRQIEIEKEKVELIKDHANVTVIFGGSGALPVSYPVK